MLLQHALPSVASEIVDGFIRLGRPDLAAQLEKLELVTRCPCNDDFCATFYTQPDESWDGQKVERFIIEMPGLFCIQTVNGIVARVELLSRPEVRARLRELFPVVTTRA